MTVVREVEFDDPDGRVLKGRLYGDASATDRAIVFCHGFLGTEDVLAPAFASGLLQRLPGSVVITFDYSGFGGSPGPYNSVLPEMQCRNARGAVEFAVEATSASKVCLLGISFGTGVALVTGATSPEVAEVVVLSAYRSGEEWLRDMRPLHMLRALLDAVEANAASGFSDDARLLPIDQVFVRDPDGAAYDRDLRGGDPRRAGELTVASIAEILTFRPIDYASLLQRKRCLFLHCERDVTMWPAHAADMAYRAQGRFELLPKIDHYQVYEDEHLSDVCNRVAAFLGGEPPLTYAFSLGFEGRWRYGHS